MGFLSLFVFVVLSAGPTQPPQVGAAPIPGNLRWVCGVVTAVSADALTVKLKKNSLTLVRDAATEVIQAEPAPAGGASAAGLAVGSQVEVHYLDKNGARRAVLIFDGVAGASIEPSKRPGRSYRGLARYVKRRTLSMRVDTRNRSLNLDSHTALVDAHGRSLAVGSKGMENLLGEGDELLVKYHDDSDIIFVDDIPIFSGSAKVLEIRMLRRSTPKAD